MNDSVRRYPELAELVRLKDAGWVFRPLRDGRGELAGLVGTRCRQDFTDALFVFDRGHFVGARVLDGDGCVWLKDGGDLAEIARDLSALPEPDAPGAPRLVRRPSLLWTP
ncbi:hypothetical protein [Actinokineospora sp. UTMC 2448]|uniref:hypothetical protein n=1 Tax=Actinokineospora sp. UTMC 2448 TaxID=2268449 RepID=UPI002164E1B3|nr:hypothetical protein [Actinokineospora sp. UTMC 2448]UVS78987.1 hypothetical protein Actkin_02727 [Actinokineospora sp. UTMC 2448]